MELWHAYKRQVGAGLALIGLLVATAIVWIHRTGLLWAIPRFMREAGPWGLLLSYGLVVLQSIVPYAPFALLAGFNTSAHGFWLGYALSFAGVVTGNLILFLLGNQIVAIFFHGRVNAIWRRHPRLEVVKKRVVDAPFWPAFAILFILRVLPWVPSSLLDILSGATGVKFKPFILSTLAGQAPTVAAMAYLGHRLLNIRHYKKGIMLFLGMAILLFVVYIVWRIVRKNKIGQRLTRL